jgi:hypothetical protein
MPTLTTYRLLGIDLIGLLSGIFVAAWIARFFAIGTSAFFPAP